MISVWARRTAVSFSIKRIVWGMATTADESFYPIGSGIVTWLGG
jgi:hypothetical protein